MSKEESAGAGHCLRTFGVLAASGAMLGALGAGTASAHESAPEPSGGGPLGAVQTSGGALLHHMEEYHLSRPAWEVESLLTSPQENARIHKMMLDEMTDPFISLLP